MLHSDATVVGTKQRSRLKKEWLLNLYKVM
jgi:hypothetical protein